MEVHGRAFLGADLLPFLLEGKNPGLLLIRNSIILFRTLFLVFFFIEA